MGFFLWGVLKDMVYKEKPRTIPYNRRVIADKIATIDMELCQKVFHSVAARLVFCIEHNGEQFDLNDVFKHCCNLTFLLIILLSLFINSSYCACSSIYHTIKFI